MKLKIGIKVGIEKIMATLHRKCQPTSTGLSVNHLNVSRIKWIT